MRYIVADDRPVTLMDVQSALAAVGGSYEMDGEEAEATIRYSGRPVGHLTLNTPGDGLFDDERRELLAFAGDGDGRGKRRVIDTLRGARCIVAVQVLFGDGNTDHTLAAIDPIWHWLRAHRRGLLQADGEGYYDGDQLILEVA